MASRYFVYILRCGDGTLYVGSTNDIERRIVEHASGKGARYTRARGPFEVAHLESFPTRAEAMKREVAIKRAGKAGKERLVELFKTSSRRKNIVTP